MLFKQQVIFGLLILTITSISVTNCKCLRNKTKTKHPGHKGAQENRAGGVIGGLAGVATIVSAGLGIVTNVGNGLESLGNIIPGFLEGIKEGIETFGDIVRFGYNITQLIGVDLKNHAILVDNPYNLPVSVRCYLETVDKYRTDWFDLEDELGFLLKFRTIAPEWLNGIGTVQCEFRNDQNNQKAGPSYVYGGTSYGKEPASLFVIVTQPSPRVYRMNKEMTRIDGRTFGMIFA